MEKKFDEPLNGYGRKRTDLVWADNNNGASTFFSEDRDLKGKIYVRTSLRNKDSKTTS